MRIVDVSTTWSTGMLTNTYAGHHKGFQLEHILTHEKDGKMVSRFTVGNHSGTHTDAPLHFIRDGSTIDKVPMDCLIGPASLVNVSPVEEMGIITAEQLERGGGHVQEGDILVVRTGWSSRLETPEYFLKAPGFSEDAAYWMVDRGIRHVAVELPGVDLPACYWAQCKHGSNPIHKILLGNGIYITEYLQNLEMVKKDRFLFAVLPLKIAEAEGAPSRAVIIEDDQ